MEAFSDFWKIFGAPKRTPTKITLFPHASGARHLGIHTLVDSRPSGKRGLPAVTSLPYGLGPARAAPLAEREEDESGSSESISFSHAV